MKKPNLISIYGKDTKKFQNKQEILKIFFKALILNLIQKSYHIPNIDI